MSARRSRKRVSPVEERLRRWLWLLVLLWGCRASTDEHKPAVSPLAPLVRMVVISDLESVLEPCGCTSRSLGGIDRASYALAQLRRQPGPLLVVATGNSFALGPAKETTEPLVARQARLKNEAIAALLRRLAVDVIVVGPSDARSGLPELLDLSKSSKLRLLGGAALSPNVEGASASIVLSVGSSELLFRTEGTEDNDKAVLSVSFSHADADADDTSQVGDVHIRSGSSSDESKLRNTAGHVVLEPARHGRELLVVEIWPMGKRSDSWRLMSTRPDDLTENIVRVERLPLDGHVPPDPATRLLVEQLFKRVRETSLQLGQAPNDSPLDKRAPEYVGSRTCAACHTQAYYWWAGTPHARAFETLVKRGRELDLECIGCHVTGFEEPGGASLSNLEELRGVGCESCHGPGGAHVNNPQPPHLGLQRTVSEALCVGCHDDAHSDAFHDADKRSQLLVPGHGAVLRRQ